MYAQVEAHFMVDKFQKKFQLYSTRYPHTKVNSSIMNDCTLNALINVHKKYSLSCP